MARPKKQSDEQQELNIPPYVLEKAQKAYERLQNAHTIILDEPPNTPSQNIILELDPALLQLALKQAIEQLLEGKDPILDVNFKLQLTPDKLLGCIEQCFQESPSPIRISSNTYHLGSWARVKQEKPRQNSPVSPDDLHQGIEEKLKSLLEQKSKPEK